MAFADYKDIAQVLEEFQILYCQAEFVQAQEVEVRPEFLDYFRFGLQHINVRASEIVIGEALLYPILVEAYKKHLGRMAFWSHKTIRYNQKLSGIPDYFFATKSKLGKVIVGKPLLLMVEAKKNDFDEGWGQCLAEMVAAQKLNNKPEGTVYGIVSDGDVWQFGRLSGTEFTQDPNSLTIANLPLLFGALDFMLSLASQQIEELTDE
jgi:hypothetical protein